MEKTQDNSAAYWDISGDLTLAGNNFGTSANPLQVKVGGKLNAAGSLYLDASINAFERELSDD